MASISRTKPRVKARKPDKARAAKTRISAAKPLELVRRDLAPPESLDEDVKCIDLAIVRPGIGLKRCLPRQFFGLGDVEVGPLRLSCRLSAHVLLPVGCQPAGDWRASGSQQRSGGKAPLARQLPSHS